MAVSQEMSKEDQQAQNQLVHLDTEIKLLGLWLDSIAKMAGIFAAAGKAFGPLMPPAKTETAALEVHSRAAASGKASLKEPRSRMQGEGASQEHPQHSISNLLVTAINTNTYQQQPSTSNLSGRCVHSFQHSCTALRQSGCDNERSLSKMTLPHPFSVSKLLYIIQVDVLVPQH